MRRRTAVLGAAGAVGAAVLAHGAPALTALPAVRRRVSPALHGLGAPDHIALTFDDGPDPASTPRFLEALDGLGWTATFFMLGAMVRSAPGLAAEVAAAGHEVAVHGDVHRSELWRAPAAVVDDLRRARDTIGEVTGRAPAWFRPPYGVVAAAGPAAARRCGLRLVLWSAWGRDWRATATPDTVVADIATDLQPGATILLHDSDCTSAPGSWRSALGALPLLAERFDGAGWRVGPLADHGLPARR